MSKKTQPTPPGASAREKGKVSCAICGWGAHMAIHLPVVYGPRKGEPWGHAYVPFKATRDTAAPEGEQQ